MAATKKQVGELENAIVILEERLEKLEEEHVLMKQMLSMQNSLIDNLQMMLKMFSSSSHNIPVGYVHVGGETQTPTPPQPYQPPQVPDTLQPSLMNGGEKQHKLKTRMSRVV
jgi:hypothetical protein